MLSKGNICGREIFEPKFAAKCAKLRFPGLLRYAPSEAGGNQGRDGEGYAATRGDAMRAKVRRALLQVGSRRLKFRDRTTNVVLRQVANVFRALLHT